MKTERTAKIQENFNRRKALKASVVSKVRHTNSFNMKGSWGKRGVDEPLFTVGMFKVGNSQSSLRKGESESVKS